MIDMWDAGSHQATIHLLDGSLSLFVVEKGSVVKLTKVMNTISV